MQCLVHMTHTHIYADIYARAPLCIHAYGVLWRPCWLGRICVCMHTYTCARVYICAYIQDYVMALMMGTHSRLGADSPVLLLDPLVAESIAQIIIADKWWECPPDSDSDSYHGMLLGRIRLRLRHRLRTHTFTCLPLLKGPRCTINYLLAAYIYI